MATPIEAEIVLREADEVSPAVTLDNNFGEYQLWVGPTIVGYGTTPEQAKSNATEYLREVVALLSRKDR